MYSHGGEVFILRERDIDRNWGRTERTGQFIGQFSGCTLLAFTCTPVYVSDTCMYTFRWSYSTIEHGIQNVFDVCSSTATRIFTAEKYTKTCCLRLRYYSPVTNQCHEFSSLCYTYTVVHESVRNVCCIRYFKIHQSPIVPQCFQLDPSGLLLLAKSFRFPNASI